MKKVTLAHRLRYQFDNTMSRGTVALIGWLSALSAAMILAVALLVGAAGLAPAQEDGKPVGFVSVIWMTLMRAMDAGTVAGDSGSWPFLLAMLVITLGGIFVVSTLIGVLTSGIEARLDELRKGRSFVVEEGHTVILGWSSQVFSILSELLAANANRPRACVAILADKDKVEMEEEIRARVGNTGKTRIVCRSGRPVDLADLEIVNPHAARSLILLAPEAEDPDSHIIKTILALTHSPQRRRQPCHIVAEMHSAKNVAVARMVAGEQARFVLVGDLISRITVQTCRQSGLSAVYQELLDFGGDEIYFQEEPAVVGKRFGEALFAYEDSALIGLRKRDGRVCLNPGMDTLIETGDQVIALSRDDDTVRVSGAAHKIDPDAIRPPAPRQSQPEHTLILGWNSRATEIVNELDHYVAAGSQVTVLADTAEADAQIAQRCAGLRRQSLTFRQGDTTDRDTLDALGIPAFDHVITLSYSDTLGVHEADARTLVTLLHLRDIADRAGCAFSIVSEMLDIRNRDLAEVTRADDFIVSDRLVSLVLTQVSENQDLAAVFDDLFDPEGCELYLKPAGDYVAPGRPANFYTVLEAARRRGEVALGYRLRAEAGDAGSSYGVHLNPRKPDLVTFAEEDKVIVLAEG